MERMTATHNGTNLIPGKQAILPTPDGYTGPAVERLARFEAFYTDIATEQAALATQLEQLRAEGKKNSARFRELFAKKLTGSNILAILKVYGLE